MKPGWRFLPIGGFSPQYEADIAAIRAAFVTTQQFLMRVEPIPVTLPPDGADAFCGSGDTA